MTKRYKVPLFAAQIASPFGILTARGDGCFYPRNPTEEAFFDVMGSLLINDDNTTTGSIGSGGGSSTPGDGTLTDQMFAPMAANSVKMNPTGSPASPTDRSVTNLKADMALNLVGNYAAVNKAGDTQSGTQIFAGVVDMRGRALTTYTEVPFVSTTGTLFVDKPNKITSVAGAITLNLASAIPEGESVFLWATCDGTDRIVTLGFSAYSMAVDGTLPSNQFTLKAGKTRLIQIDKINGTNVMWGEQNPPAAVSNIGMNGITTFTAVADGALDISACTTAKILLNGNFTISGLGAIANDKSFLVKLGGSANFTHAAGVFVCQSGFSFNGSPGDTFWVHRIAGVTYIDDIARADGEAVRGFWNSQTVGTTSNVANIGTAGKSRSVILTGSTQLNGLGAGKYDGDTYDLYFNAGGYSLMHDQGAAGSVLCLGNANIQIEAGDTARVKYSSSAGKYVMTEFSRRAGEYCYIGDTLPDPTTKQLRSKAILDIAAPTGLTNPPTLGTKMNRMHFINCFDIDGTTRIWAPENGEHLIYCRKGSRGSPCLPTVTLTGTTGALTEFMRTAANFLLLYDYIHIQVGIARTGTGLANVGIRIGGTVAWNLVHTANAGNVMLFNGLLTIGGANSQFATGTAALGTVSNNTNDLTKDLTTALTWDMAVTAGGVNAETETVMYIIVKGGRFGG